MEELEKLKLARLTVAPVWGHGLKSDGPAVSTEEQPSPPYGGMD